MIWITPLASLFETDGSDLEAECLARLPVVAGKEVDDGQLAQLGRPNLQDGFRLCVRFLRLEIKALLLLNKGA